MKNYFIRTMTQSGNILGLAAVTTDLVNQAVQLHCTAPTASAALGRALTGGALMAMLLKKDQSLALKFEGNGPLGRIVVEADRLGNVRGLVGNPDADLPPRAGKLDVSGVVGNNGLLTVIKDLGGQENYQGIVTIRSGEIAQDLAYYFAESEQIPSAVGLGVFVEPDETVTASGGFLIQAFPPADDAMIDTLMERLEKLPPVTQILRNGGTPGTILEAIFGDTPLHTLEMGALNLACSCNQRRLERVVISLGPAEIASLIEEHGDIDITCEFCRTTYHFEKKELQAILEGLS
ncbi:MAG: 33 kDa chaperonin [Syntrophus sp. SKADARSKE-3]|nr:33 kDa chaperonin [Syntrophus sp. SKADARSKE-3]